MTSTTIQSNFKQHILESIRSDPRIVGCVDYGSVSEGRGDEWSDLDIALFIRDSELGRFETSWKHWASQFGDLLLAYIGGVGHPWAVYDTTSIPLRVNFAFHPASTLNRVLEWPNSPVSIDAMILHDRTEGELSALVSRIVGQSLVPDDLANAF